MVRVFSEADFRRGVIRKLGRPRSIAALIAASACRRIGGLVPDRGSELDHEVRGVLTEIGSQEG
jgi:hypothetical protein